MEKKTRSLQPPPPTTLIKINPVLPIIISNGNNREIWAPAYLTSCRNSGTSLQIKNEIFNKKCIVLILAKVTINYEIDLSFECFVVQ